MRNVLLKDNLYQYCVTPPLVPMTTKEKQGRTQALSAFNESVKNAAIKLLRKYWAPFDCWTSLKDCYESNNHPRKVTLINKFFSIRKGNSIDEYLIDMKEAADLLEKVGFSLLESIVCYYIVNNLLKEYEVINQMIFNDKQCFSYWQNFARKRFFLPLIYFWQNLDLNNIFLVSKIHQFDHFSSI